MKEVNSNKENAKGKSNNEASTSLDTSEKWKDPSRIEKEKPAVSGMEEMLERCGLKLEGRHHSGLDDSNNIARCVVVLLEHGFVFTQGMVYSERNK